MSTPACLTAALDYHARDLSVIPLHTPTAEGCSCQDPDCSTAAGKHPRGIEWKEFQARRATEAEIRAWWRRWPTANVGLVTGVISRLAVLDIDPRNGGIDTLHDLDAGAVMPDDNTLAETGSRGLHHYFALDAPLAKGAPFQGIELQADGALVVAPPSLHHSGRRYRWCRDPLSGVVRDLNRPWTPLPAWLRWAATRTARPADGPPPRPLEDAHADDVLGALATRGLYIARHRRRGLHRIRCPWADAHTGDPEAVVVEPGASPAPGWGFRCLHAHCAERALGELLDVLGVPRRGAS